MEKSVVNEWEYLVLDSGAIIKGYGLNLKCKQIVTVKEVKL